MTEAHLCDFAKARPCPHKHTRAVDPRKCGPLAPCVCLCCGKGLLMWNPWEKR